MARKNFITEAGLLARILMNLGDGSLPRQISEETVRNFNKQFVQRIDGYRVRYATPLRKFFHSHIPQTRPLEVVYPFGGGDLISALLAFPDAPIITTLSLEQAGDPNSVYTFNDLDLQSCLNDLNRQIGGMLSVGSNTSENLSNSQQNGLPFQVISFLTALAVHKYEPVSMYYFGLNEDGSINYFDEAIIATLDEQVANSICWSWRRPSFSPAFANVEIQFRSMDDLNAPIQVFRHIAANLHNGRFNGNIPLRKHLKYKRHFSGLVKGASYLLWRNEYSTIRDYMLTHMPLIVSDSTGIPVEYAESAGFRLKTFGRFSGSFLRANNGHNEAFRTLWNNNPYHKMPLRFGYVDCKEQAHLMISSRL